MGIDVTRLFTAAEAAQYAKDHRSKAQRFVHSEDYDAVVELAFHLRHCRECGETDVMNCDEGRPLWCACFTEPTPVKSAGTCSRCDDGRRPCECGKPLA